MDAKEIKACLKAAREAIRSKEFKEALKQCKAVLAVEKNNYNALVFIGVAAEGMDQPDQALKAYRRATEESPDQLLAWQGLSSMYDKDPVVLETSEAITVFQKLVCLNSNDAPKQIPFLHKLADLYIKTEAIEKALETLTILLDLEKEGEGRTTTLCSLITLLEPTAPKLTDPQLVLYKTALHELLETSALLGAENVHKFMELLLMLISQTDLNNIVAVCENLKEKYPDAIPPVEFLLRYHLDQNIGNGNPSVGTSVMIEKFTKELTVLDNENELIKVGESFLELQDKNFIQARDKLKGVDSDCICGQYYLSQAFIGLHAYEQCLKACEKGLAACATAKHILCALCDHVVTMLKLAQTEAYRELAQTEAYKEIGTAEAQTNALALLEEIEERMPNEAFIIKAYINLDQGKLEEAEKCVEYLPQDALAVQTLTAAIYFERKKFLQAVQVLQVIIDKDPTDARSTLLLGLALWELRDSTEIENAKQDCFTTLMKAAKLDPHNYKSFLYLGYFYKQIQQDTVKARRCFQKAYELCPGGEKPGCALVDTLVELGEESQSLKILETITSQASAGGAKWAWLRLGLYQIKHKEPTTAITSLQSALRADPNDNHVWECLAEAYLQRGSFTASLKAFTKASELDPDSLYCLYQMASIKHTLGSLSEAITEYKNILSKSKNYVPVLKGVGESLVQLAKQNLNHCLDGLAQDNLEESICYLTRAASQRPDMSCLWKLMGDACTLSYCLHSDCYCVPSKLVEKSSQDGIKQVKKAQLLQIGARCYSQAVKILPDSGALWHDLSVNLYHQSQVLARESAGQGSSEVLALTQRATQAIRKAISLQPKDWHHWNVLGVIACSSVDHKPALAQHCFIKSIECEASNVTAWTNLGTLYLSKSEIQLAHDAFKAAQSVDPTYVACWIGQALIAEIVGHEEAMDLFRHTTELGFHPESAVGYGQWVLAVLGDSSKRESELFHYSIHQMAAVPAASDTLTRYTGRVTTDPVAYNMQGLLFEHQNLFNSAADTLQRALTLFEQSDPQNHANNVRMNLARVLCKQGKYEESLKQFEKCDLGSNVEHTCFYGLALFRSDRLTDSFKVYQHALELVGDQPAKSQIYTALGMVAYKLRDMGETKSQLFDGFQTSQPSPEGLLALCSLGLLQQDLTLVSAVFGELLKRDDCERHLKDVALLQSYKWILEGSVETGEAQLREMIQAHPSTSSLWSLLATLIITQQKHQGAAAVECAATSLSLQDSDSAQDRLLQTLGQLLAGHHQRQKPDNNALKAAQKAFHLNPGRASTLSTLACAVHAEAIIRRALTGTGDLLTVEKGMLETLLTKEPESELEKWCLQQLVINSIENGDITAAKNYLKQLQERNPLSPAAETLVQSVNQFLSSQPQTSASINVLEILPVLVNCALYCHNKEVENAVSQLQQCIRQAEGSQSPTLLQNLQERVAHLSFLGLQDQPENAALKESFEAAVKCLKEKEMHSPSSSLLQALIAQKDNKRLAKHHFATVLDQVDASKELGYCSSAARSALVTLLWDSTKESDQQLVKALIDDARAQGDSLTTETYKKLAGEKS